MAAAVFEFRKDARLTRPEEFKRALQVRPAARSSLFFCHFVPDQLCNGSGFSRLGLIIPKRFAKRATTRNAIKRVVREAFRTRRPSLPYGDFVIRLKSTPSASSLIVLKSTIRGDVDLILDRMSGTQ